MNKNTLMLLAGVVVLGVIAYLATRKPEAPAPKSVAVSGYASPELLEARAKQGIMDSRVFIDYPIDEVIYTFKDETIHLVREGEGKTSSWLIKAPVDAVAVKYQVEKMIALFEEEMASIHARDIKPEDHVRFDLEPETRVAFTFKSNGQVWNGVDFIVGKVSRESAAGGQRGGEKGADTWIMKKGEEGTIYRMAGKDLRAAFEVPLSDIRDKKVLKVKPTDLVKLELQPPKGPKLTLSGVRTEVPPKADAAVKEGDPKPEPTFKVAWSLTEPAGVRGDKAIDGLARNFANLRTREFVSADKGPEKGLGPAYELKGTTHDGKVVAVKLAAADTDDKVWAQVVGTKEWLNLDKFVAKNLRKSLADLKDKALFGDAKVEDVTMLATAPVGGGEVRVERKDGAWVFTQPQEATGWAADPEDVLRTVVTARATRFATAEEFGEAATALSKPEFMAGIGVKGVPYMLKFGPKMTGEGDTKNQRWASLQPVNMEGKPADPFLVQDFTASRFRKPAADMRRKELFDFQADALRSIRVTWPEDTKTVVELTRGSDGAWLPAGVPEGKKPKSSAVTSMTATLGKLKVKKFVYGKSTAELGLAPKGAYLVTATLADGKSVTVTISKKTDGTDPYATVDSGPLKGQLFTLNKFQVDNLQKSQADLIE